jgi:hypothetical protein
LCFNVKVKPIELDCLRGTNVERSNTSIGNPGGIVWSKGTPQKVCEIYAITSVVQVIIPNRSSQGKKEFGIGVLLAIIESGGDGRAIRPHLVVARIWGVSGVSWAGVFWGAINGIGGHAHSNQSICLRRERVDKSDRYDINRLVRTIRRKNLLRTAGTLLKLALFLNIMRSHIPNTQRCFLSQWDYNPRWRKKTERTQPWPQPKIWWKTLWQKE